MKRHPCTVAVLTCTLLSFNVDAATFYSQGSLNPCVTASWNSLRNGGGIVPANFSSGDVFIIQQGHEMVTGSAWVISGTSSKIWIENGGVLTANHLIDLVAASTFQINNGGTYIHNNTDPLGANIFAGTEVFAAGSIFEFRTWTNSSIPGVSAYGNLIINNTVNSGNIQFNGQLATINGDLVIQHVFAGNEVRLSANGSYTLNIAGDLQILAGKLNGSNGTTGGISYSINLSGDYDQSGGSFSHNNPNSPLLFTFNGTSQDFSQTGGSFNTTNISFILANGTSVILKNDFTIASQRTLYLNSVSNLTVIPNATLSVAGAADFNGQAVLLQSDPTGTGRIGPITGTISNATNVTVERYLSDKTTRKSVFLASPVTADLSSAWQQQIFITGPGSGGAICNPGDINSPPQPGKNNNGFDASGANQGTVFTYNTNNPQGSRWVSLPNTSTALTPGKGYRVLVRGHRSQGCILLTNTTEDPQQVTLSATGTLAQGDIPASVGGNAPGGFSLLGNPYPSEIDFDNPAWAALRAAHDIEDSYWTFNPSNPSGIYSAYNAGDLTNAPAHSNDNIIASGQSFFVRKSTGGNASITNFFQESFKAAPGQGQPGLFKSHNVTWTARLRIALEQAGGLRIDETLVRFTADSLANNTAISKLDAVNINESSQGVATIKSMQQLAIQTRKQLALSDTIALAIHSAINGNFRLSFEEMAGFNDYDIILLDQYKDSIHDVRAKPSFAFTIDSAPASKGGSRFRLVFRKWQLLPAAFISFSAEKRQQAVLLRWEIAEAATIFKFIIERSTNGFRFSDLAMIRSGVTDASNQYSYSDPAPPYGTLYYRIRVEGAQTPKHSSTLIVNNVSDRGYLQLYPNPVRNGAAITICHPVIALSIVKIFSALGQPMSELHLLPGTFMVQIQINHLPTGRYTAEIIDQSGIRTIRHFFKL